MIEKIRKLKKVELHLHLDGSVLIETIKKISDKDLDDIKKDMIANDKCENLSEYLTKFDLPISYMQTKENLITISKELVDYLESQNVIYAEIRFAPMFHTNNGLTYEEIIESVLEGLKSNTKVKTNLILCMMRGFPKENNIKTIEVTEKYLNKGVCAIDLAGAEDKYPLDEYIELFDIVKEKNIPFTIHAGENGSYEEIEKAIKIGAKRIGHGIHAIENEHTQELIKNNNVLLEICPTSNVQTNAIDEYKNNPIYNFYKNGLRISISTDNKTVSNISLNDEYIKLYNTFNLGIDDFNTINKYATESSFLSNEEKEELLKELEGEKIMEKKNNNKILISIIVVLSILLIGSLGYIVYDKFLSKEENKESSNLEENKFEDKESSEENKETNNQNSEVKYDVNNYITIKNINEIGLFGERKAIEFKNLPLRLIAEFQNKSDNAVFNPRVEEFTNTFNYEVNKTILSVYTNEKYVYSPAWAPSYKNYSLNIDLNKNKIITNDELLTKYNINTNEMFEKILTNISNTVTTKEFLLSTKGDVMADKVTLEEFKNNIKTYVSYINNRTDLLTLYFKDNKLYVSYIQDEILTSLGMGTHMDIGIVLEPQSIELN